MSGEKEAAAKKEIIEIPLYTEEVPAEANEENKPRFETDVPTLLERLRQKAERDGYDDADDAGDFEENEEEGENTASFSIASLGNAFAKMLQKQKQDDYRWLESTQEGTVDTEMWKVHNDSTDDTNSIVQSFCFHFLLPFFVYI